jgi:glucose-6-phosphate isomerase
MEDIWQSLQQHQQQLAHVHLRELFANHPQRFEQLSVQACNLLLDYSKNRVTRETINLLNNFLEKRNFKIWQAQMFNGEKINHTEQRAALHIALRNRSNQPIVVDNQNVMPEVNQVLKKMGHFIEKVHNGEWKGFTEKPIEFIVNIGIGGSDLGPKMVTEALEIYHHPRLQAFFISNLDALQLHRVLKKINPETTLFIIASKTFSTQETMTNAQSARRWLIEKLGDEKAVSKHFVAVSTSTDRVKAFGIDPANMFEFWDWVGGRYSLWSAIGLPIALMIGMKNFEELLSGAHEMDQHFRNAPLKENMPVILGLIGFWYANFFGTTSHAILPYDYTLEYLPAYLQQLEMESNGKRVSRDGETLNYRTCPVVWGTLGNNGQHAFYQLLHQGTQLIPSDFIISAESQVEQYGQQNALLSNALAQTKALMQGRNSEETRQSLNDLIEMQVPHRLFLGNQPSTTIAYKRLTPKILGSLLALYEHKVFVQSVCWNINPFDQWGVELGKQMAAELLPSLENSQATFNYDASTNGLLTYLKAQRT